MALTRISEIRRRELRAAAYEVLQTEGLAGATIEKVALKAGASKGIVLHYFKTKQQLFEHAMRHSNALLRDEVIARMRQAGSPEDRLWAIIAGNFSANFFTPAICHAWLSLCAEVPREPQLARIQRVIHARMRSNLDSALVKLTDKAEVANISLAITTLIDGLWLRLGLQSGGIDATAAMEQMADYLSHRLPKIDWRGFLPEDARASRRVRG